ncbi:zinc finger MYND domain-containing protein 12 [Spea bombifrons]|uniref:zinc finger MYND domain-containing protein 12 n=1 Tax=Spea bombifrons TaxID=233779 RepID=UPI0023493302|nr:zinc finger MYND domain-containing protein 12 [Spea bombifrons]
MCSGATNPVTSLATESSVPSNEASVRTDDPTMAVNPLSNPKGVKLVCELCRSPAYTQCPGCKVTYYCDVKHQQADWLSIHEKICQLLIPLRTPVPFFNSAEERQHCVGQLVQRKKHLIEITMKEAQKFLYEGRHGAVIPAAAHSLSLVIDVYGLTSLELVPVYLVLAEANIGLGQLTLAEEYLSQAYWTVLKTSDCTSTVRSKLHRNLGLLYSAKGEFEESLRHLSNDVYFASFESGPDSIYTSGGYFHMANIFFRQNKMDIADSLYTEVTDIWHRHLKRLVDLQVKASLRSGPVWFDDPDQESLDENQEAEALQILSAIWDIREQASKKDSSKMVKVLHALTMLYFLTMDLQKAQEAGKKLLEATQQLPPEDTSEDISALITLIDLKMK